MDPKSIIASASLDTVDGSGRTLAVGASSSGGGAGAALGSGAFGKVGTYSYHGATVAVKELKAGADEDTIGARFSSPLFLPRSHSPSPRQHLYPLHALHVLCFVVTPCGRIACSLLRCYAVRQEHVSRSRWA